MFRSTQTGERFKIRQDIDCKSDNIICLVTCKRCKFQGVGSCTKLSQRVSNYITSIEKKSPGCNIEKPFSEGRSFNCRLFSSRNSETGKSSTRSNR